MRKLRRDLPAAVVLLLPFVTLSQEPVQVQVVRPEFRKIPRTVEQPGSVRAEMEAPLAAKLAGYVAKVHKDIGDPVKTGEVLAEISVPELDAEAKHKESLVKLAQAAIVQAGKQQETVAALLAAAKALVAEASAASKKTEAMVQRWSSEAQRLTALAKMKVVDEQSRDEAVYQWRSAESAHEEAKAKIASAQAAVRRWEAEARKAESDLLAEQAKLEVAKAELERVKALVDYKTIRAPFDGVVTRRFVDPGHFLQPGQHDALFIVANFTKVRVQVDVPESDAALVKKGDNATVRIQALRDRVFTGTVARLSQSLDPNARTLRAEIDLQNPNGTLLPGMYAYVKLSLDLPNVRAIPTKALSKAGETMACFVVRDGKAVRVRVKVGRSDGEYTEIVQIQSGSTWAACTGDELLIANPPDNLTDGTLIRTE